MKYLRRTDIEAIGKNIFEQYKKLPEIKSKKVICNIQPELIIEKMLGFKVEYYHLSLERDILGITCTDDIGIDVYNEDSTKEMIYLDGKTILIEKDLCNSENMYGRLRFTLCHESSHLIYKMLFPADYGSKNGDKPIPLYSKVRDAHSQNHTIDWQEWQADVLASAILMPIELIEQGMFWLGLKNKIHLDKVFAYAEYDKFSTLAAMLGVSKQALEYRMEKLGMIDKKQLSNPFEDIIVGYSQYMEV